MSDGRRLAAGACLLPDSPASSFLHLKPIVKIVVVSPHRDDAAFSLGLAVEHWLTAGHTVSVLNCFTKSAYAPYSDADSLHPNDRISFVSAIRRREDLAWNKLLSGRLHFHDLDLLDAPLRLACTVEEVFTTDIRAGDRALARVAGAIAKLVRSTAGDLAIAAPLGIGGHIDHRIARGAVLDTLVNSSLPLGLYEDLPYAARPGVAERLAQDAAEVQAGLDVAFASYPGDPAVAVHRKARAAECYESQIDSGEVRSLAEFAACYGGRERLWANAHWRASALSSRVGEDA